MGSNALLDSIVLLTPCVEYHQVTHGHAVLKTLGPAIITHYKLRERWATTNCSYLYCSYIFKFLQLDSACPCKGCIKLMLFLENPAQTQCRFKIDKENSY